VVSILEKALRRALVLGLGVEVFLMLGNTWYSVFTILFSIFGKLGV